MKFLSLFIFCLGFFALKAQTINQFDNLTSRWNVLSSYIHTDINHPNNIDSVTTIFGINGDSLLNGDIWYKIASSTDQYFVNNLTQRGIIRYENEYVFYKNGTAQIDTIYNFNLNVGDSVKYVIYGQVHWLKVDIINTINIQGQQHKVIRFKAILGMGFDELRETWIEGIGSVHGPLFPLSPSVFSTEIPGEIKLSCAYINNDLIWQNPGIQDCYINKQLSAENIEMTNVKIYPNPFSDWLQINTSLVGYQIEIVNNLGQIIWKDNIQDTHQELHLSGLRKGMYFLYIKKDDRQSVYKIIKE